MESCEFVCRVRVWLVWTLSPPEPETHLQRGRVQGVMPTNILLGKSAHKQTITPALHTCDYAGLSGDNVNIPTPSDLSSVPASCHQMSASQRRDQRGMLWHRSSVPADPTPPLLRSLIRLLIARKKWFWRYWNFMFGTRLPSRYLCNSDIRSWTRLGTNPAPVSTCLWCPMSYANCENCGCWLQKQLAFNFKSKNISWAKACFQFHGRKSCKDQRKSSHWHIVKLICVSTSFENIHQLLTEFNIRYSWIIIPNSTYRVWTGTNSSMYKFTLPCLSLEYELTAVIRLAVEMCQWQPSSEMNRRGRKEKWSGNKSFGRHRRLWLGSNLSEISTVAHPVTVGLCSVVSPH